MIPIRFVSTHRADAGHVDPLRAVAQQDQRFQVTDGNRGIVFVQGDRTELLGEIMSAVADNAVIAHAAGGERTLGSTDDRVRDALTKLAHLHYPVHQEAKRRLILLGEEEWRVCVSGEVGVDTILAGTQESFLGSFGDVIVAVHPSTAAPEETGNVLWAVNQFLESLSDRHVWFVAPNGDPGSEDIEACWRGMAKSGRGTYLEIGALDHRQFIALMRKCGTIIGNSSCLVTEAPHVGCLPILIGTRQQGRIPAPSDGMACQHILDHMAHCWQNPALRSKA